eukprot:3011526-Pyramimonas_sp.AAC.1
MVRCPVTSPRAVLKLNIVAWSLPFCVESLPPPTPPTEPVKMDYSGLLAGAKQPVRALSGRSRISYFWREIDRRIGGGP